MIDLDPERLRAAVSAAFGGIFYGLYTLAALLLAGQTPTTRDMVRAILNVFCAIVAGAIVAYFLASGLAGMLPWTSLRDPGMVGFAIGAVGWEVAPILYQKAREKASKLGGGS